MAEPVTFRQRVARRIAGGSQAFAAATPAPSGESKPVGRSGTVNTRGFIQDREFNAALRWPRNLDVYDEMRKTDPTVRWMTSLVQTPIRAAEWTIEPGGADPEDLEVAAFVAHNLFDELDGGWADLLRRILTYLDMGHSVFERIIDLRDVEFEVKRDDYQRDEASGQVIHTRDARTVQRSAFVIARLEERLQRTIYKWVPRVDDPGRLDHIEQTLTDGMAPTNPNIEAERLVIFTNEMEGSDYRGQSLLRAAWRSYEYIFQLENTEALAIDRSAGCPVAYPPDDATPDQLDEVEQALKDFRRGDTLYLIAPGPKQGTNKEARDGWLFEDLIVKGEGGISVNDAVRRYESRIAQNILAEFMKLGHEQVGARATADVQQDPYYQAVEAVIGHIEDAVTEQVIRPLVDWNYEVKRYPKLSAGGVQQANTERVAQALAAMVNAKVIQPTPDLEAWARKVMDAPEKPAGLDAVPRPAPPAGPPPPPGGDTTGGAGGGAPDPGSGAPEPGDGAAPGRKDPTEAMHAAFAQFIPPRPLRGAEQFVAWQQLQDLLDNGPEDLVTVGERAMAGQIESAVSHADDAVRRNAPEDLDLLELDPAPLTDALEAELRRLYAAGQADVRAEVRRQVEATDQGAAIMAQPPRIPLSPSDIGKVIRGLATNMAESGVQAALRAVKARALKTIAQRRETPAQPGEDPSAALRAALRAGATPAVNRTYTLGRMDELRAQHNAGMVPAMVYSAVLDGQTCEPCASWDGTVVRPEEAIDLPNPECEGGDACRCQWLPELTPRGDLGLG